MQHPDFTQQLARDRRERYRSDAGRSRLARPARTNGRANRTGRTDGDRD